MLKKVHAVVAQRTFPSKHVQNTSASDDFWKFRCRKSARRCGAKHILTKNAKITARSGHFWKLRCGKSARRCGAKHISKSKGTKYLGFGPIFDDSMAIRCRKSAPLWREAHLEVKCVKCRFVDSHFCCVRCRFVDR